MCRVHCHPSESSAPNAARFLCHYPSWQQQWQCPARIFSFANLARNVPVSLKTWANRKCLAIRGSEIPKLFLIQQHIGPFREPPILLVFPMLLIKPDALVNLLHGHALVNDLVVPHLVCLGSLFIFNLCVLSRISSLLSSCRPLGGLELWSSSSPGLTLSLLRDS